MANLKGKTFDRQIRDARIRLEARGTSRHNNPESAKSHSHAVAKKRDMYFRDFSRYAESRGLSGKLNVHMGDRDLMNDFLINRVSDLSKNSAADYVSGMSALLRGLEQSNITIHPDGRDALNSIREIVRVMPDEDFRTGRAFAEPGHVLSRLFDIRYESGVLAQIQYETGFRANEAYKLAKEPDKYLVGNKITEMIGKGNHRYDIKQVSRDLVIKLAAIENLPTHHTYLNHIRIAAEDPNAIAHDWRITYVREHYNRDMADGMTHKEALLQVSREVNHHRPEITQYYLARA